MCAALERAVVRGSPRRSRRISPDLMCASLKFPRLFSFCCVAKAAAFPLFCVLNLEGGRTDHCSLDLIVSTVFELKPGGSFYMRTLLCLNCSILLLLLFSASIFSRLLLAVSGLVCCALLSWQPLITAHPCYFGISETIWDLECH